MSSNMNPPAPSSSSSSSSTSLIALSSTPAAASSTSSAASIPFASTPWSPATRGWLVPTAAQVANEALVDADGSKSRALALAANRDANRVVLHATAAPKKRQVVQHTKQVVEEDEYIATVDSIIRRDFFPAIEAMERKIVQPTPLLRVNQNRTQLIETPMSVGVGLGGETPMQHQLEGQATPAAASSSTSLQLHSSAAAAAAASTSAASPVASTALLHPHELRLGSYLELHTSEDNASFSAMNEERRAEIQRKYFWANKEHEQKANDQRLVLANTDHSRAGFLDTWKYEAKNRLFFYPDHGGQSELDVDPADTTDEAIKRALAKKSASIEYENTRFKGSLFNPKPGVNSSSKAAIGTPSTSVAAGGVTPLHGYKFLQTPTPAIGPGDSPLMTYGNVVGTPAHLSNEDLDMTDATSAAAAASLSTSNFRIAPTNARDATAWKLVDDVKRREAAKKKRKREDATPVPLGYATPVTPSSSSAAASARPSSLRRTPSSASASPAPVVMMSPAAQRLLGKIQDKKRIKLESDEQLQSSYGTPTPTALQHGRTNRTNASTKRQLPPVPLFHATPLPLQMVSTPQRAH